MIDFYLKTIILSLRFSWRRSWPNAKRSHPISLKCRIRWMFWRGVSNRKFVFYNTNLHYCIYYSKEDRKQLLRPEMISINFLSQYLLLVTLVNGNVTRTVKAGGWFPLNKTTFSLVSLSLVSDLKCIVPVSLVMSRQYVCQWSSEFPSQEVEWLTTRGICLCVCLLKDVRISTSKRLKTCLAYWVVGSRLTRTWRPK